jgi:hypothetical protein
MGTYVNFGDGLHFGNVIFKGWALLVVVEYEAKVFMNLNILRSRGLGMGGLRMGGFLRLVLNRGRVLTPKCKTSIK